MMSELPTNLNISESKGLLRKGQVAEESVNDLSLMKKASKDVRPVSEFTLMSFEQKFKNAEVLRVEIDREKRRQLRMM